MQIYRGHFIGQTFLDGRAVDLITAFLFHRGSSDDPVRLSANKGKGHVGSVVVGMGFTFDDTNSNATPIKDMEQILARSPQSEHHIFPYIGGDEVNSSPVQAYHRYVIDLGEFELRETAEQWPELLRIVEQKVRPERESASSDSKDVLRRKQYWWRWARRTPELYNSIRILPRVLVIACVTQHLAFAFLPVGMVYAHTLNVFAFSQFSTFCVLQCRVHEVWARFFTSTFEDRLRYNPSDCFDTFAFPHRWEVRESLEQIGKEYYEFRANMMARNSEGLTETYNRFHNPDEGDPGILKLRELHNAMDRAVLDAYGWSDLKPTCEFILDYSEEDEDADGRPRKRKKPWRYRWPDEFRDEVLARLLALNQERATQEKIMGSADGVKKKSRRVRSSDASRTLL